MSKTRGKRLPLLVVDGYNVINATTHYQDLVDDDPKVGALSDVSSLSRDPYGHDPYESARAALVNDVATYAQRRYEAVVVFDAAGNLSGDRPEFRPGGVRVIFSKTGESADTVIERLASRARAKGREVLLVTSDNTIRFTVGGVPVTTISSQLLVRDIRATNREVSQSHEERSYMRMTVEGRIDSVTRAKLWEMLGR